MSRKMKVDMTGVESYTRCPEGQFPAKISKMEECTIQGSGDDGLKVVFEVTSGSGKGCKVYETLSLGEKALWKLKMLLEALGMKATGKITIDLDKLEGKSCGIEVIHDEYNGQKRAKISQYLKLSELEDTEADEDDETEDEDEEDEEPVKKSSKKAPAKKVKKSEPEPEEDEDEDDEDDEDEEEEPAPKKSKKPEKKPAKKALAKKSKKDEDDDEDDWEEDDD